MESIPRGPNRDPACAFTVKPDESVFTLDHSGPTDSPIQNNFFQSGRMRDQPNSITLGQKDVIKKEMLAGPHFHHSGRSPVARIEEFPALL